MSQVVVGWVHDERLLLVAIVCVLDCVVHGESVDGTCVAVLSIRA